MSGVGGLPELPEAEFLTVRGNNGYSIDQMRAYGQECARQALAAQEWIAVGERLPEDYETAWVVDLNHSPWLCARGRDSWACEALDAKGITHWQSLRKPAPPAKESE